MYFSEIIVMEQSVVSVNDSKLKSTILLPELLIIIFGYLDAADKCRASQVCKTWNTILKSKSLWRGTTVGLHFNTHFSKKTCKSFKKRGITHFQIFSIQTPNCLTKFVNNMSNITSLCLKHCFQLKDDCLFKFLPNNLPNITELNLSLCFHVTDTGIMHIANGLTGLTKLEIRCCRQITANDYLCIAQNLKKLIYLSLELCIYFSKFELTHICGISDELNGGLPQLEYLAIDLCLNINNICILYIATTLNNLRVLSMSFCICETPLGMHCISFLSSLKELNIGYSLVTDETLKYVSRLNSLEILNVCYTMVTDIGLGYILKGCPNLNTLIISNCNGIQDLSVYKHVIKDPDVPNFRISHNVSGTVS